MGCGSSSVASASTTAPQAAAYQVGQNEAHGRKSDTLAPPGSNQASSTHQSNGSSSVADANENHHRVRSESNSLSPGAGNDRRPSKRLTLPPGQGLPASPAAPVGATVLNLQLQNANGPQFQSDSETGGSLSARRRSGAETPRSARGRKQEETDSAMLVSIPFFESLDKKAIQKLRAVFQRKKYSAGEWISRADAPAVAENNPADSADFFVIISGEVKLSVTVFTGKTAAPFDDIEKRHVRPDPNQLPQMESEEATLAVLQGGNWFGADALSPQGSFQKANIVALSDCVLLSISRDKFREFSAGLPSMQTNIYDILTNTRVSLRSLPFFNNIDELKLQQLSQLLEFRRFDEGQEIMREGDIEGGMFIILNGTASVSVRTKEDVCFHLTTLCAGEAFGEQALLASGPYAATVTANSKMLLLFLSGQRFRQFEVLAPEASLNISAQRTSQLLKTIPLFDVLCQPGDDHSHAYDESKLSLLASLFEYKSLKESNRVVFHEGDRADSLYIIVKGTVEVSAKVESGTVVLNTLKAGDFFGEISMLFPTLRSATVTTVEPCMLLCLAADKFARFLSIAPELRTSLQFAIGPRVASIIENIPFFRHEIRENKPWSKLGLLGELCQFEKREENEVIYRQGDKGDQKLYVIVAGAVLITKDESASSDLNHRRLTGGADPLEMNKQQAPQIPIGAATPGINHRKVSSSHHPGVILRRGNYFAENALLSDAPHWGTCTSLCLSVFLTLSKANFEKYVKIAPELKHLIMKRQEGAPSDSPSTTESDTQPQFNAPVPRNGKRSSGQFLTPATNIAGVASNQSLASSPIFTADDQSTPGSKKKRDKGFQPSTRMKERHPELHRLATAARVASPPQEFSHSEDDSPVTHDQDSAASSPLPNYPTMARTSSTPHEKSRLSVSRIASMPHGDMQGSPASPNQPHAAQQQEFSPPGTVIPKHRSNKSSSELRALEMQNSPARR